MYCRIEFEAERQPKHLSTLPIPTRGLFDPCNKLDYKLYGRESRFEHFCIENLAAWTRLQLMETHRDQKSSIVGASTTWRRKWHQCNLLEFADKNQLPDKVIENILIWCEKIRKYYSSNHIRIWVHWRVEFSVEGRKLLEQNKNWYQNSIFRWLGNTKWIFKNCNNECPSHEYYHFNFIFNFVNLVIK